MRRYVLALAAALCWLLALGTAAAAEPESDLSRMAEITNVRVNEEGGKLRIVVDASRAVAYRTMALSDPSRIIVDIQDAWISADIRREIALDSPLASKLRMAQFDKSTVRIVVETSVGKDSYRVFALDGGTPPGRVVMDFGSLREDVQQPPGQAPPASDPPGQPSWEIDPPARPAEDVPTKVPEGVPTLDKDELRPRPAAPIEEPANEAADGEDSKDKKKDKKRTGSLEDELDAITGLKGKDITIDPGHGGSDAGAIGPTGVMEKDVTLRIAKELKKLLEEEGATVHMTRMTDTEVSPKKAHATDIEELQARCDVANRHKSDIFISIHMDSFTNRTANGTTGYYYGKGDKRSYLLADRIRQGIIDQIGTNSRGTQTCEFYVVRHTDMPATLVEVAFISHPEEEKLLNSEEGIRKAAQGIADGIGDYFG